MKDIELQQAAAKAAGIEVWRGSGAQADMLFRSVASPDGKVTAVEWSSLADDGDALRLAVRLRIKLRYNEALGQALAWPVGATELQAHTVNVEDCGRDENACTRRAITRAAAAMAQTERTA